MDHQQPGPSRGRVVPFPADNLVRTPTKQVLNTRPNVDLNDDEALEAYIMQNLDDFDSGNHSQSKCFMSGLSHKRTFYEVRERECFRALYVMNEKLKGQMYRDMATFGLSFPEEVLNYKVRTLIAKTDNAPTVQIMRERLLEILQGDEEGISGLTDDTVREFSILTTRTIDKINTVPTRIEPIPTEIICSAVPPPPPPPPPAAVIPVVTDKPVVPQVPPPTTPNNSTISSDEIFQTPCSKFETTIGRSRIVKNKTMVLTNVAGEQGQGRYFNPNQDTQPRPPSPSRVFHFVGNSNKEPRLVNPGEILYSATGSPIVLPASAPPSSVTSSVANTEETAGTRNVTPLGRMNAGVKTVRVKVDNPGGPPLHVDVLCRDAGHEDVFRNFMTGFNGYMRTRSMAQNKVMAPRVPNSGGYNKRTHTTSTKKPIWKV